jgi:hypothetical protein
MGAELPYLGRPAEFVRSVRVKLLVVSKTVRSSALHPALGAFIDGGGRVTAVRHGGQR